MDRLLTHNNPSVRTGMKMRLLSPVILIALLACAITGTVNADHVIVSWTEIGKSADIIGYTGERLFNPSIYRVEWSQPPRDPVVARTSIELSVIGIGDKNVLPPVSFSSNKGQLVFLNREYVKNAKSTSRVWAHEAGGLDIPVDFFLAKDGKDFQVGTQIELSWTKRLFLQSDADDSESVVKSLVIPNASPMFHAEGFSSKAKVTGQLGLPLGQVCRITGQWDAGRKREGLFFHVHEVNAQKVEGASWQDFEIREVDQLNMTLEEKGGRKDSYSGKKWLLEGCEVGAFSGQPIGYPRLNDTQVTRRPGFYTGFVWWSRAEIAQE